MSGIVFSIGRRCARACARARRKRAPRAAAQRAARRRHARAIEKQYLTLGSGKKRPKSFRHSSTSPLSAIVRRPDCRARRGRRCDRHCGCYLLYFEASLPWFRPAVTYSVCVGNGGYGIGKAVGVLRKKVVREISGLSESEFSLSWSSFVWEGVSTSFSSIFHPSPFAQTTRIC